MGFAAIPSPLLSFYFQWKKTSILVRKLVIFPANGRFYSYKFISVVDCGIAIVIMIEESLSFDCKPSFFIDINFFLLLFLELPL